MKAIRFIGGLCVAIALTAKPAAAQEFVYLLEGRTPSECASSPSACEGRLARIDLQTGDVVGRRYTAQPGTLAEPEQRRDPSSCRDGKL